MTLMQPRLNILVTTTLAALLLAGCASDGSIYVPMGGDSSSQEPDAAPEPPQTERDDGERRVRKSEQPEESEQRSESGSRYQEQGDELSPAAVSLMREADAAMRNEEVGRAVSLLERAQRISPRSAEVYFKLSEAYVMQDNLGAAEQFTLKGLSLAGNNTALQRTGWNLLADIRRAEGDTAGAQQAEDRASAL